MKKATLPALWLIVLIVGLPLLSETVYSPSLPNIAADLAVKESWIEYTLTIYLAGFSVGTLFWGKISDKSGRKPSIIAGFSIYILGCVGCLFSSTISMLLISRFIQAFGGSVGSVLGQAICRDAFKGPALGKVYSSTATALSVFPAIGPIIGGNITEYFGWYANFIFLFCCGALLLILITLKLPETLLKEQRSKVSIIATLMRMAKDKYLIGLGILVAASNGISFSYFSEGPFYLISMLGLSPSNFGLTFIGLAAATMLGGLLSSKLQDTHLPQDIITLGIKVTIFGSLIGVSSILLSSLIVISKTTIITATILSLIIMTVGSCLIRTNALYIALQNYQGAIGTASSLFGSFYYSLISAFTLVMGLLHHHDSLLRMPLYFFTIAVFMLFVMKKIIKNN